VSTPYDANTQLTKKKVKLLLGLNMLKLLGVDGFNELHLTCTLCVD